MKKIIFKKGIHTIRFIQYKPLGDFMFEDFAQKSIEKIKSQYEPRKNVQWSFECSKPSMFCYVVCSK